MSQELQYLREELNQMCDFWNGQTNKVINTVLVTWGGFLVILGAFLGNVQDINKIENEMWATVCFVGVLVFLISNEIIYILARKFYDIRDSIFRIGAYILVFYEKLPNRCVGAADNLCWESIHFDMKSKKIESIGEDRNEYRALTGLSFIVEMCLSAVYFGMAGVVGWKIWVTHTLCVLIIIRSIYVILKLNKYTSPKRDYKRRAKHLYNFFRYAIDIGYHTEQEIDSRFGDIYETCKKECGKN